MAGGPFDNPLGAKPVLPPPSGAGAEKAATLFQRLLARQHEQQRQAAQAPAPEPARRTAEVSLDVPLRLGPEDFGGGRRYDRALALWASIESELRRPRVRQEAPLESEPTQTSVTEAVLRDRELAEAEPAQRTAGPRSEPPFTPLHDVAESEIAAAAEQAQALAEPLGSLPSVEEGSLPEVPDSFRELLDYVVAEAADDAALEDDLVAIEGDPAAAPAASQPHTDVPHNNEPSGALIKGVAESPAPPLRRPPPGSAAVRPSVPKPAVQEPAWDPELMSKAAQGARMVEMGDGSFAFEIDFSDDVFEELRCRIAVQDGKLMAVFRVQNQNLRRLLEAESGRLRAQLEGRGLRVTEIRVEVG